MSIRTEEELRGLRRVGRVVARALAAMREAARPGVTTAELDAIAEAVLDRYDAHAASRAVCGFPAATCISVNDEAVHGIPGPRRLRPGDLVKLDVTAELDGYYTDSAVTVAIASAAPLARRLPAFRGGPGR